MKHKPPALTPLPEVPLHNRYDPLIPNTMCDDECNTKMNKNKTNGPKTQPRANQNIRRSLNATTKVRATEAINATQNGIDTILTGDSVTQYVRMAKTENITFSDTSVGELIDILPTILSTHPDGMKIIIHTGSFDILRRKTGSEIPKRDFSLLLERLCHYGVHCVSISGPILTVGKGI